MSRPRAACTDCALPFYSDDNESCPYCGAPGPTDARAAPGRERVTCPDCGLAHYGDVEECPYCATATANAAAVPAEEVEAEADTEEEPAAEPASDAEPDPEPSADSERTGGEESPSPVQRRRGDRNSNGGNPTVVGRVLGAVRSLFGR